jgi:putative flippase GtrA
MGANLCGANAFDRFPGCTCDATSSPIIVGQRVTANPGHDDSLRLHNLAANRLSGFSPFTGRKKATEGRKNLARTATLVRWCKFNLVGVVGIFVQFGVLFLLKSGLHFNYLAATMLAVEAAVVHNFFWHERFTWADRTKSELRCAQNACASENLAAAQSVFGASLGRFLRFNLTTGLVSIGGNLGMMRVLVGRVHMNYLAANWIAIALCSLVNFLVSDGWVFGENKTLLPRICPDRPGFGNQS